MLIGGGSVSHKRCSTDAQNRMPTVGRSAQIARCQIDERLADADNN
jgi:hypothetical protein